MINLSKVVKAFTIVTVGLTLFLVAGCLAFSRIQPVKVEGIAMRPALNDGDLIIIDRSADKLARGDIVIFLYPEDPVKSYIKRIIGMPNETVEIRNGKVFINGQLIVEPYIDPTLDRAQRSMAETRLAGDSYFVMGDNRDNSSDSRIWGPLQRKFIYGKYVRKYFEAK